MQTVCGTTTTLPWFEPRTGKSYAHWTSDSAPDNPPCHRNCKPKSSRTNAKPPTKTRGPIRRPKNRNIDKSLGSYPIDSLATSLNTRNPSRSNSNLSLPCSEPPASRPVKHPVHADQRRKSCCKPGASSVSESVNYHASTPNSGDSSSVIDRYCRGHSQQLRHSSPASIDELEAIAHKAFHSTKLTEESNVEAHLRIGTILAAEAQLEEIHLHRFSQCLIGDIKITPSESTPTTTENASSSTTPTPRADPPNDSEGEFERSYTISDAKCVDMTQSTDEEAEILVEPPKPTKMKVKKRFKGHGWAMKGTKTTRRKARSWSNSKQTDATYSPKAYSRSTSKHQVIYFKVPYQEREMAKQMGARWDNSKKLWYANNLKTTHEMGQHWVRAITRTRAKISTDALPESNSIGIPLMPPPLHVHNKKPVTSSSTSRPTSINIAASVRSREMSINERNLQEYRHFSSLPDANPPPFVPVCDSDIDKLGLERMERWLQQQ